MTASASRYRHRRPIHIPPRGGNGRDRVSPESRAILDQLIDARYRAGMTQRTLAGLIGERQQHVSNMESGRIEPSIARVARYAKAVGMKAIIIQ